MEQRIYLVHQKPHSLKKKSVVVKKGDTKEIVETLTSGNKHTRRTFAGRYDAEKKTLVIGIAGNHSNDPFVRSVGAEVAMERVEKISSYLQAQKKQVVVKDLEPEGVKDAFFTEIEKLKI